MRSRLKGLVSDQMLTKVAREPGFVRRPREIHPAKFFWTLVLAFATSGQCQIAGLRTAYESSTGDTLVPLSFCDRFTPVLMTFLKRVFTYVVDNIAAPTDVLM